MKIKPSRQLIPRRKKRSYDDRTADVSTVTSNLSFCVSRFVSHPVCRIIRNCLSSSDVMKRYKCLECSFLIRDCTRSYFLRGWEKWFLQPELRCDKGRAGGRQRAASLFNWESDFSKRIHGTSNNEKYGMSRHLPVKEFLLLPIIFHRGGKIKYNCFR